MKRPPFNLSVVMLVAATLGAASHYNLRLDAPQSVADKELKPGDYRVEMAGDKAVFTAGRTVVEVPAAIQKADRKYSATSFEAVGSRITEIHLGGTNTKIVFSGSSSRGAAQGNK